MSRSVPNGAPSAEPRLCDVIVIGAGVAGTGAALAAAGAAARVTMLDGGTGASTLATGAVDCVPWRPGQPSDDAIPNGARAALDALDAYSAPAGGVTLLTTAGIARPARGRDAALLDVRPIRGRVGVIACRRPGWHAAALAGAWREAHARFSPITTFEAFDASLLRYTDEDAIPDADFAARHDDRDRLSWLAQRLREALARAKGSYSAIVLPPSLGVDRARAEILSREVGVPCGEATTLPGGPAGLRFERARDRALAAAHVERVRVRAAALERRRTVWRVTGEDGEIFDAAAVVLATGGLIGGGLGYAMTDTALAMDPAWDAAPILRLTVAAPFTLGVSGRPLSVAGALLGYASEASRPFAKDALIERAGVIAATEATGDAPSLFAAGDIVADQPRTWLGALASGVGAGERAARRQELTAILESAGSAAKASDEGPPSPL